jgi:hypothetical protein
MPSKLAGKFRSLWMRPALERRWLLPAWCLLGVARPLILVVPFRQLARRLGRSETAAPWVPLLSADREQLALQLGRAIRTAARYTPWQSQCFAQTLVARLLLGWHRLPAAIFFGVARSRDTGELQAHAWVMAGRVCVCGGDGFRDFAPVACFVSGVGAGSGSRASRRGR